MLTSVILLASLCSTNSCDFYPVEGLKSQGTIAECQHKINNKMDLSAIRQARDYEIRKVNCYSLIENNDSYFTISTKEYGDLKLFK